MLELAKKNPVIPVLVLNNEEETKEKLQALLDEGICVAEITLRSEYALEAIRYAKKNFPDICVGVGSVVNEEQAKQAIDAGVEFVVSPGLSEMVAKVCKEREIPYLPGCVTPTEMIRAMELGIYVVKFFPADVYGGLSAIKALAGPFTQLTFIPTGGVNAINLKEFLSYEKIVAVGGSFMMKGNVRENCREIVKIINEVRGE